MYVELKLIFFLLSVTLSVFMSLLFYIESCFVDFFRKHMFQTPELHYCLVIRITVQVYIIHNAKYDKFKEIL